MRLWSLHPRYLDPQGLVALWREGLLAQAVLQGRTRGYTRHPQLERFRAARNPVALIARYLREVAAEARRRGYRFDEKRIAPAMGRGRLAVPRGQLLFEWRHLSLKLRRRHPAWSARWRRESRPRPHPLFWIVPGPVAAWERDPAAFAEQKSPTARIGRVWPGGHSGTRRGARPSRPLSAGAPAGLLLPQRGTGRRKSRRLKDFRPSPPHSSRSM
ncbi:MAG TPA: pyrimidine dimer DNA glycosylase/endonuclease V [Planctomycetota bacterium]|nr:pyrimidine dimer DNA glycosylase/endonuclease V [Planctomycetota bacterium]